MNASVRFCIYLMTYVHMHTMAQMMHPLYTCVQLCIFVIVLAPSSIPQPTLPTGLKSKVIKQQRSFVLNIKDCMYNQLSVACFVRYKGNVTDETTLLPLTLMVSVGALVCVGILLLLIIVLVVCFCGQSCPGYRYLHAEKKSNSRLIVPYHCSLCC